MRGARLLHILRPYLGTKFDDMFGRAPSVLLLSLRARTIEKPLARSSIYPRSTIDCPIPFRRHLVQSHCNWSSSSLIFVREAGHQLHTPRRKASYESSDAIDASVTSVVKTSRDAAWAAEATQSRRKQSGQNVPRLQCTAARTSLIRQRSDMNPMASWRGRDKEGYLCP